MTNKVIRENIKMSNRKVLKITDKSFKDVHKPGMKIITMNKCQIELKTIPSFVKIEDCKLYIS